MGEKIGCSVAGLALVILFSCLGGIGAPPIPYGGRPPLYGAPPSPPLQIPLSAFSAIPHHGASPPSYGAPTHYGATSPYGAPPPYHPSSYGSPAPYGAPPSYGASPPYGAAPPPPYGVPPPPHGGTQPVHGAPSPPPIAGPGPAPPAVQPLQGAAQPASTDPDQLSQPEHPASAEISDGPENTPPAQASPEVPPTPTNVIQPHPQQPAYNPHPPTYQQQPAYQPYQQSYPPQPYQPQTRGPQEQYPSYNGYPLQYPTSYSQPPAYGQTSNREGFMDEYLQTHLAAGLGVYSNPKPSYVSYDVGTYPPTEPAYNQHYAQPSSYGQPSYLPPGSSYPVQHQPPQPRHNLAGTSDMFASHPPPNFFSSEA
eukprot:TRINITY_DN7869_c0_g1_i5.p1 TRINITY_DN7869_c0_g1~~TRINITY_DN7869_c0_g1_i5.p1  ORF type:complete len:415 (+),score=86.80 TRINITY_DN7869_c0_g1_i5:146-1246(+)